MVKGRAEIVVGAQWGDEGKGRVVDAVADRVGYIVRYQGGANAGHTVVAEGQKYVFHLLPSGMLYPGKTCIIGNGVVVDPEQLIKEIQELREKGRDRARLVVSHCAHVVMPYHKILDVLSERARSTGYKIGTTSRGIGPCYVDKYDRIGIRMEDLVDPDVLREKLGISLEAKNLVLSRVYGEKPLAFDECYEKALAWGRELAPYLGDSFEEIAKGLASGKGVLFEGAQGTLLDVDHGTYPFVTSSSPVAGGACIGAGIGPTLIDSVIGVVKAYCTRVGEGPFVTEETGPLGNFLRDRGAEFGATTGRPRRCGWLDLVALDYAVKVNGLSAIALTKLDVLTGIDEILLCTGYEVDGQKLEHFPSNTTLLKKAVPIYETMRGWAENLSLCTSFESLPEAAQRYIERIEAFSGVPVKLIGIGPSRESTIIRGL